MVNDSKEALIDCFRYSVVVWGVLVLSAAGYCSVIALIHYRVVWSFGGDALFVQFLVIFAFQWYCNDSVVVKWQVLSVLLVLLLQALVT